MKKLLTYGLAALLVSAAFVSLAQADVTAPLTGGNIDSRLAPAGSSLGASTGSFQSSQGGDDIGCGLASGQTIAICLSNLVYYPMVGLGSWFAYIAAFIFDYAVLLSLNGGTYALDFIATGWTVVRDISNMAFLFVLVYIGFKIILGAETAGTIRLLVGVVVIALLMNFSFTMTRLVIDTGNILAVQFYNAIGGPNAQTIGTTASNSGALNSPGSAVASLTTAGANAKDLTAGIMNALQIQSITGNSSFQTYAKGETAGAKPSFMYTLITLSVIYIATGIIFFILAGAFLFAAAKFIMRMVGLWFVIIFAPVAFISAIFREKPEAKLNQLFHKWLTYLIQFSFYPAVFLFMFWVTNLFAAQMGTNLIESIYTANAPTANSTYFAVIAIAIANVAVRLGFIIAMLYIALSMADKLADYGAGAASWFQRTVLSGAAGGAITRPAAWLANSRLGQRSAIVGGAAAAVATRADLRNIPGLGATLRGTTAATGKLNEKFGTLKADYSQPRDRSVLDRRNAGAQTKTDKKLEAQAAAQAVSAAAKANERIEPKIPNYTGAAPDPRVWAATRDASNLPKGARIEPVAPMGQAPAVTATTPAAAAAINTPAAASRASKTPWGRSAPAPVPAAPEVKLQPNETRTSIAPSNVGAQRAIEALNNASKQARAAAEIGAASLTPSRDTRGPDLARSFVPESYQAQTGQQKAAAPIVETGELKEAVRGLQHIVEQVAANKMPDRITVAMPSVPRPTPAAPALKVVAPSVSVDISEDTVNKLANRLARKLPKAA